MFKQTNIIVAYQTRFSMDQERRLGLLLDRKRLCTEAQALGGAPISAGTRQLA
jgi:hypothetical protein